MTKILFSLMMIFTAHSVAAQTAPSFQSTDVRFTATPQTGEPFSVQGKLNLPAVARPMPAVILLHGSAGIDGRGAFHAKELNAAGIATFEIEMFAPGKRPASQRFTFPHAFGAFDYLLERPEIDAKRIATMGFSWGGGMSVMLAKTSIGVRSAKPNQRLAAHVAFYPVCYAFTPGSTTKFQPLNLGDLTGAPLLVLAGSKDDYDEEPDSCQKMHAAIPDQLKDIVTVHIYPGATHGWDGPNSRTFDDPVSHMGKGGRVSTIADPAVAQDSRARSVQFFKTAFKMN